MSERLNNGGADLSTGRSLWYAYGPQGETRQLTSASGSIVDTYGYTAYGVQTAGTGTDPNPFQYGGQVGYYTDLSAGSALILCTNRWYSPILGRWLSRDPIGYEGGENEYEYCDGDPVSFADGDGLREKYKVVCVFGDQHGVPLARFFYENFVPFWKTSTNYRGWMAKSTFDETRLTGKDVEVVELNQPSRDALIAQLVDADEYFVWSHGNETSQTLNEDGNNQSTFDMYDLQQLISRRKGKKKMYRVQLRACDSVQDKNFINSWLQITDEVGGFPGWSTNPNSGQIGVFRTFRKPMATNPSWKYINRQLWPGPSATPKIKGRQSKK